MRLRGALRESDPKQAGQFRLLGRLGTGGMGVVYLGESKANGLAAVKVVRHDLADDPTFAQRFRREVDNAKRVSSAYTARVVDSDLDGDQPWLATEFIDGPTLHEAVTAGERFAGGAFLALSVGLAEALAAIHLAGIVHRDFKPSNILLAADGPRVVDFGIARALDATAMTHTGMTLGSPPFMAPEQITGDEQTQAVDVFAWAGTLVFAATGGGPFGSGEPHGVMYRVLNDEPRLEGVNPDLVPLLRRALDKRPDNRPSINSVLQDLTGGVDPTHATTLVTNNWVQPKTQLHDVLPTDGPATERRGTGRRRWTLALGLGLLLAAVTAGAVALAAREPERGPGSTANAPDLTPMPDVRGLPSAEAQADLQNRGFTVDVQRRADPEVEEGHVIAQSRRPNADLSSGSTVTLFVSTGPREVEVPNLEGTLALPAVARLDTLGLQATTSEQTSDTVEAGRVISQDPSAGASIDVDTTVNLVVSTGPAALSASLVGSGTDLDPTHWAPSGAQPDEQFQQRIFGDDSWTLVSGFPVTMNGCSSRQLRVSWRSVAGPVEPAIADYWDPTVGPSASIIQTGEASTEGTMIFHGCQQPAFRTPGGDLIDVVVESSVYVPAVGG